MYLIHNVGANNYNELEQRQNDFHLFWLIAPLVQSPHVWKRERAAKKYLYCGLANARSLNSCQDALQHHLTISDLDLLSITETWLNEQNGDDILRDVCPEGYVAIHRPGHVRRGGGVALIHRSTLRVNPLSINVEVASFEHLSVSIKINSV